MGINRNMKFHYLAVHYLQPLCIRTIQVFLKHLQVMKYLLCFLLISTSNGGIAEKLYPGHYN